MRVPSCGFVFVACVVAVGAACHRGDSAGDPTSNVNGVFADPSGIILVGGAPSTAPSLFDAAKDEGVAAPCLIEPEPGTMYPKNWLPPRFTWTAAGSNANLFELVIHPSNRASDLRVYTTATTWSMPAETWAALQSSAVDVPITVELRGAFFTGRDISDVTTTNHADVSIAPVEAPGSIVYWSVEPTAERSRLMGLTMESEGVIEVLRSDQMTGYGQNASQCMGCHTATPDGNDVAVTWERGTGGYQTDLAQIAKGAPAGPRPDFMSRDATAALTSQASSVFTAFSRAHWAPGDRVMLTNDGADLVWIDLDATSSPASAASAKGVLGHAGETNARRMGPAWTHDGASIVYMAGALADIPFDLVGPSDLFVMPYAARAGASATAPVTPLRGASSVDQAEYYPAISPDDALVAFNGLPDNGRLYDNPSSEIFVVPTAGGERTRLRANDPPACGGKTSPGITNSWPKWAPAVQTDGGRSFYFVVFSSRRHPQTSEPQLYIAPVVVDAAGTITSYPAVYLRGQETVDGWQAWGNHTPAWDDFAIDPDGALK